jgi:hypothetical protein
MSLVLMRKRAVEHVGSFPAENGCTSRKFQDRGLILRQRAGASPAGWNMHARPCCPEVMAAGKLSREAMARRA